MSPPVCTAKFTLNNGTSRPYSWKVGLIAHVPTGQTLPAIGLGTWQGTPGSDDERGLEASIIHSLQSGYRLIDTAQAYGVEKLVGRAIRNSGIPRFEITVITKFWGEWHHDPAEALRKSLESLAIDYIDMFLMHWPQATTPDRKPLRPHESPTFVETWKMMEPLVGPKCRAIGVSNFSQKTLDTLLAAAKIVPAVNQVELHALNPNHKLIRYCKLNGIHVMSWGTLGGDSTGGKQVLTNDLFISIGKAHDCTSGVVSLSWAVQRGITVIPKSSSKSRIEANIGLVTLTDREMKLIDKAHQTIQKRRTADYYDYLWEERDGRREILGWTALELGWEDEQGNWLT